MTGEETRPVIVIGRPSDDRLAVNMLGRLHPDADDFWDGNWLATSINVELGAFRGTIGAALRADELRAFRLGLQEVYDSLDGEAVLTSMEDWLSLRVVVNQRGHVGVTGTIRDRLGGGNVLSFQLDGLDQTDLVAVIDALQEVEERFPVIGSP